MRMDRVIAIVGCIAVLGGAFALPIWAAAAPARDVKFCLTCHVMAPEGRSYQTSFHRSVASCSSCHAPSLAKKYSDGVRHLVALIMGAHPDFVVLQDASREVVIRNCYKCHEAQSKHARTKRAQSQDCLNCHQGHWPVPTRMPGGG